MNDKNNILLALLHILPTTIPIQRIIQYILSETLASGVLFNNVPVQGDRNPAPASNVFSATTVQSVL
jgi:hypothetical protein